MTETRQVFPLLPDSYQSLLDPPLCQHYLLFTQKSPMTSLLWKSLASSQSSSPLPPTSLIIHLFHGSSCLLLRVCYCCALRSPCVLNILPFQDLIHSYCYSHLPALMMASRSLSKARAQGHLCFDMLANYLLPLCTPFSLTAHLDYSLIVFFHIFLPSSSVSNSSAVTEMCLLTSCLLPSRMSGTHFKKTNLAEEFRSKISI